jgi:hypothetical protein
MNKTRIGKLFEGESNPGVPDGTGSFQGSNGRGLGSGGGLNKEFGCDDDQIEKLANYAHDAWSRWMKYLFSKGIKNEDGSFTIDNESVSRWEREMITPYSDLPEEEKESDREEANKILEVLNG